MEMKVPISPFTITIFLFGALVIFVNPRLIPYRALPFVVHMFSASTIIPGIIKPCANITTDISALPTVITPNAPNKNIIEFPIKNAVTVDLTATFLFFANRAKSGVKIPALIKEPITIDKAVLIVIIPEGLI